jgi:hypothetical protein
MSKKEMCEWEIAFRKQTVEDGHTIEMLDKENKRLLDEVKNLKRRLDRLETYDDD